MKNAAVELRSKVADVRGLLERVQPQFGMVLARHITPERFTRVALTTIINKPKLLECTRESLLGALMKCAQLGLEPDGVANKAHILPFWNSKARRREATLVPGYKGLMDLAYRSGEVEFITADVVYEADTFDHDLARRELSHKRAETKERGGIRAFYAIAWLKGRDKPVFVVRWLFEIEEHRDKFALARNSSGQIVGPWVTDFEAMAKKTVVLELCRWLPSSTEKAGQLAEAVALDARASAGVGQDLNMEGIRMLHEIGEAPEEPAPEEPPAAEEVIEKAAEEVQAKKKSRRAKAKPKEEPPAEPAPEKPAPTKPTNPPVHDVTVVGRLRRLGVTLEAMVREIGADSTEDLRRLSFDQNQILVDIEKAIRDGRLTAEDVNSLDPGASDA